MPCNVLADEILTPGEGQVRALISVGGNPVVGFPDQLKMARALDDLELFVQIDPWMSASARRADVVLAPSQCLEREDITSLSEWWHEEPYARYTEAVVAAPGDCIDEYEMFWTLAHHLGIQMNLAGGPLPMDRKPSKQEFLDLAVTGCLVPPSQVRKDCAANGGAAVLYPEKHPKVEPVDESEFHRFDLAVGAMPSEILKYAEASAAREGFDFRLISRRSKTRFNSIGHPLKKLQAKTTTNPAFIHPDDRRAGAGGRRAGRDHLAPRHDPRGGEGERQGAARDRLDGPCLWRCRRHQGGCAGARLLHQPPRQRGGGLRPDHRPVAAKRDPGEARTGLIFPQSERPTCPRTVASSSSAARTARPLRRISNSSPSRPPRWKRASS
jgi:hypothetical protein